MADLTEEQERVMTRLRAAAARVNQHEDERTELAAAIVEALKANIRPRDIHKEVPYDRNHVRRIAKAAGLPPLREPTVQPKEK